jgi:long-chain acyl-CoA synthetase
MDPTRISDRTTVGVFLRQVDRLKDRNFLRYHDGSGWRDVSWREAAGRVLRLASRLVQQGVKRGDRVVLMSENRVEWLLCDLAIQAAGAITVPIYPSTTRPVADAIVADSEAVFAFAADEKLAARLGSLPTVRFDREVQDWISTEPAPDALAEVEARCARTEPDDMATIVYTSGTTGEPKGVVLPHRSIVDVVRCCLGAFDLGPDDLALSFLPYSHVLERVNGVYVGLAAGMSAWLCRGMNQLLEDIQECRPTVMVSVPRVYEKIHQGVMARVRTEPFYRRALFRWAIEAGRRRVRGQASPLYPLADRLVLSGLRRRLTGGRLRYFITGGAPLTRDVEEFFWAMGIKILQGWGMTETSSAATANTEEHHRFETAGRPLPGVELEIAEDGEILVRSPGNMTGYYRNPEATAATVKDGWVLTGDIGEIDSDGFLHITDRKKDLIKTAGGKFVAPQPIETQLQQDPLIERVVLVGDLRPYVSALVVPDWEAVRHELEIEIDGDPAQLVTDERVRETVQSRIDALNADLGSWETVKRFTLLPRDFREEEGELTPSLKVKRRVIQERYAHQIDEMYDAPRETRRQVAGG